MRDPYVFSIWYFGVSFEFSNITFSSIRKYYVSASSFFESFSQTILNGTLLFSIIVVYCDRTSP